MHKYLPILGEILRGCKLGQIQTWCVYGTDFLQLKVRQVCSASTEVWIPCTNPVSEWFLDCIDSACEKEGMRVPNPSSIPWNLPESLRHCKTQISPACGILAESPLYNRKRQGMMHLTHGNMLQSPWGLNRTWTIWVIVMWSSIKMFWC